MSTRHRTPIKSKWAKHMRDHDPCVYCLAPAECLDHIVPWSAGGSNGMDNLAPACLACNQRKGNLPLVVFLAGRRPAKRRVSYPMRLQSLAGRLQEALAHVQA